MKIGGRKKERKFVMQKLQVLGTKQIGMATSKFGRAKRNMNIASKFGTATTNMNIAHKFGMATTNMNITSKFGMATTNMNIARKFGMAKNKHEHSTQI
jgi:hypothetical protein